MDVRNIIAVNEARESRFAQEQLDAIHAAYFDLQMGECDAPDEVLLGMWNLTETRTEDGTGEPIHPSNAERARLVAEAVSHLWFD